MTANEKEFYRSELIRLMEYVKISKCANYCNISQSNLSWFLKGRDELLSLDKLRRLYDFIYNDMLK